MTSPQVEAGQQLDSLDSAVSSLPYPGTPPSLAPPDTDTPQILRDLIMKKKQLLFGRLSSLDSEAEDAASVAASDSGSMTTNPAFQRGGRGFSSIRSAVSDNEMDDSVSQQSWILDKYLLLNLSITKYFQTLNSPSLTPDMWPVKSSLTSGYRYRSLQQYNDYPYAIQWQ